MWNLKVIRIDAMIKSQLAKAIGSFFHFITSEYRTFVDNFRQELNLLFRLYRRRKKRKLKWKQKTEESVVIIRVLTLLALSGSANATFVYVFSRMNIRCWFLSYDGETTMHSRILSLSLSLSLSFSLSPSLSLSLRSFILMVRCTTYR